MLDGTKRIAHIEAGKIVDKDIPLRNAMNELLRDEYVEDCEKVLRKWNKAIEQMDYPDFRVTLPSTRFHRRQGIYADAHFDPQGNTITAEEWLAKRDTWLPTEEDRAYVSSLMKPNYEPGKMANWIAAPRRGINGQSIDTEYVRV